MGDSYHHGNLRQALIDAGVRIINESGVAELSLRKVATLCEVSHAAPYAHFKDKEALVDAIRENVTEQFMGELIKAVDSAPDAENAIIGMGKSYVTFFHRRPDYFKFLFGSQDIAAHPAPDEKHTEDYPPFVLLKDIYKEYIEEKHLKRSKKEQEMDVLRIWASAHGLAAIACMSGVKVSFDWEKAVLGDLLLH